ncbi:MAG: PaaI family thioesterase [Actinomycetota bacterium]|nr:PaaI family thioesterase [Actinomycetota bacterium]
MPADPSLPPEQARRLDELFRSDRWAGELGAELVTWGGGTAEVALRTGERHHNFGGLVHGGVLFSLADVALSYASNSWGRVALALGVDAQFLRAAGTGRLVARATEVSRTRRTGAYRLEVHEGADRLVATFSGLTFRTDEWHFGDDAWPAPWVAAH